MAPLNLSDYSTKAFHWKDKQAIRSDQIGWMKGNWTSSLSVSWLNESFSPFRDFLSSIIAWRQVEKSGKTLPKGRKKATLSFSPFPIHFPSTSTSTNFIEAFFFTWRAKNYYSGRSKKAASWVVSLRVSLTSLPLPGRWSFPVRAFVASWTRKLD